MDKGMIARAGLPANACHRLLTAAATDNAAAVAAVPVQLKGLQGHVARTSPVFLKLYDKATAPTSADTPIKTVRLPESTTFAIDLPAGVTFTNGLGFRLTTAAADADAGALAAGDVVCLNLDYAK